MPRLRILFVASECVPFAKTGGLADVVGALPAALAERGHDVRVVIPRYRMTKKVPATRRPAPLEVQLGQRTSWGAVWETHLGRGSARIYLLEHDQLFDRDGVYGDRFGEFGDNLARFAFLSRGALSLCHELGFVPDVVHAHDWPTCLAPVYLDTLEAHSSLARTASVLTIHNLGYQGWFDKERLPDTGLGWGSFHSRSLETYDRINLLKAGIFHSTLISTVSPTYAREIQAPGGGEGLDGALRARAGDIIGVLNGIDDEVWNPANDPLISANFTSSDLSGKAVCKATLQRDMGLAVRPDVPLIGVISRLVHQKGIDVFARAIPSILRLGAQLVVLGSGDAAAEELFARLSHTTEGFRAVVGMNEKLAHRIEAGADLFLMPSRYEPCGLNQMYSQRYGTLPIVRAIGGLDDTVENDMTGFKFHELSAEAITQATAWAVSIYRERPEHFRAMQAHAMAKRLGWSHAARQYEALYRMAVARRRGRI
jgi:starch synthase